MEALSPFAAFNQVTCHLKKLYRHISKPVKYSWHCSRKQVKYRGLHVGNSYLVISNVGVISIYLHSFEGLLPPFQPSINLQTLRIFHLKHYAGIWKAMSHFFGQYRSETVSIPLISWCVSVLQTHVKQILNISENFFRHLTNLLSICNFLVCQLNEHKSTHMWIKPHKVQGIHIPNTPEVMLFKSMIAYESASSTYYSKKVKKITFILLLGL